MWLEQRVTQSKISKFVVGCMQETMGKSWGKERLEERARRFRRHYVKEAHLFFIGGNKDQAHEKQPARLKDC